MGVTSISVSVRGKDTYFTGDAELYRRPDVMSVSFWLLYLDLNISIGFELNEFNPSTVGIKRLTAYKLQSWRKIPIRKFQRYVLDAMIPLRQHGACGRYHLLFWVPISSETCYLLKCCPSGIGPWTVRISLLWHLSPHIVTPFQTSDVLQVRRQKRLNTTFKLDWPGPSSKFGLKYYNRLT